MPITDWGIDCSVTARIPLTIDVDSTFVFSGKNRSREYLVKTHTMAKRVIGDHDAISEVDEYRYRCPPHHNKIGWAKILDASLCAFSISRLFYDGLYRRFINILARRHFR